MTLNDLISEFEVIYELGSLGLPGIEPEEIINFLDIAQYTLINQRLQGQNAYQTKYPDTIKRIDDLNGLIINDDSDTGDLTLNDGIITGTKTLILPEIYFHLVEDGIRLLYSDGYSEFAKQINVVESQRFSSSRDNGTTGPYIKRPVYYFSGKNTGREITIFPPSENGVNTISIAYCLYIKKPTLLSGVANADLDLTDFNDDVYHEIVKIASENAVEVTTPQKAPVSMQQTNRAE